MFPMHVTSLSQESNHFIYIHACTIREVIACFQCMLLLSYKRVTNGYCVDVAVRIM